MIWLPKAHILEVACRNPLNHSTVIREGNVGHLLHTFVCIYTYIYLHITYVCLVIMVHLSNVCIYHLHVRTFVYTGSVYMYSKCMYNHLYRTLPCTKERDEEIRIRVRILALDSSTQHPQWLRK